MSACINVFKQDKKKILSSACANHLANASSSFYYFAKKQKTAKFVFPLPFKLLDRKKIPC